MHLIHPEWSGSGELTGQRGLIFVYMYSGQLDLIFLVLLFEFPRKNL